jgi:hypothetical protein
VEHGIENTGPSGTFNDALDDCAEDYSISTHCRPTESPPESSLACHAAGSPPTGPDPVERALRVTGRARVRAFKRGIPSLPSGNVKVFGALACGSGAPCQLKCCVNKLTNRSRGGCRM